MHALVLCAVFAFTLVVALLVAARRPPAAAAVTVVAVGWPATLVEGEGGHRSAGLAAALSVPVVLRARSAPSLVAGAGVAGLVVTAAVWASPATAVAREAALDWAGGTSVPDRRGEQRPLRLGAGLRRHPLPRHEDGGADGRRAGPRALLAGIDTDLFTSDRWFEDLFWLARVEGDADAIPLDRLTPWRAARRESWIEQRVEVKALVDDHLAAAGTPVALDTRQLGGVFLLSGGVLRVRDPLDRGRRYRVWSYVPDPAPVELAAAKARYRRPPPATEVDGRPFPAFGAGAGGGRRVALRELGLRAPHELPPALEVRPPGCRVGCHALPRGSLTESWFRQRGGYTYDEQPPRPAGPPLVAFVTGTKAGYCQHFAGAMAVMLRMLDPLTRRGRLHQRHA